MSGNFKRPWTLFAKKNNWGVLNLGKIQDLENRHFQLRCIIPPPSVFKYRDCVRTRVSPHLYYLARSLPRSCVSSVYESPCCPSTGDQLKQGLEYLLTRSQKQKQKQKQSYNLQQCLVSYHHPPQITTTLTQLSSFSAPCGLI